MGGFKGIPFLFRKGADHMPTTILIADDHASWRAALKRLLEQEVEVTTVAEAGGGEEAIHLARTLRPDVVFMDIAMPDVNGLEATRRIKAEQPDTRVIIMTIYSEEAYRKAAAESGADAFLPKKTLMANLLPTIRQEAKAGEAPSRSASRWVQEGRRGGGR